MTYVNYAELEKAILHIGLGIDDALFNAAYDAGRKYGLLITPLPDIQDTISSCGDPEVYRAMLDKPEESKEYDEFLKMLDGDISYSLVPEPHNASEELCIAWCWGCIRGQKDAWSHENIRAALATLETAERS